ncbi:MAG: hypothetical protein PHV20_07785 [Bacteroidales bacterium]|nr:hypothetical protein [Bacteroidales bacterium]
MEKIVRFDSFDTQKSVKKDNHTTVIINKETRIISIHAKNSMNEMQASQKILSLYKKEF